MKSEMKDRIEKALVIAVRFNHVEGENHKAWVIDQMVRALAGIEYQKIVDDVSNRAPGQEKYIWDIGIAP
jgi:hypothetical protein